MFSKKNLKIWVDLISNKYALLIGSFVNETTWKCNKIQTSKGDNFNKSYDNRIPGCKRHIDKSEQ